VYPIVIGIIVLAGAILMPKHYFLGGFHCHK